MVEPDLGRLSATSPQECYSPFFSCICQAKAPGLPVFPVASLNFSFRIPINPLIHQEVAVLPLAFFDR